MNKSHKMVRRVSTTLIFIAAVLTAPQAFAESATLNGVEIKSASSRGYDIVLNTENAPEVQKKASASDKIVLDLKNTKVSKETNTVYRNADGIEHVILKPDANNVKIEISGKAAGASKVSVNNLLAAAPTNYENTVFVNKPLNAYAPVHQLEEETASASAMSILSKIKNSPTLKSLVNSSNLGWIVSFALMFGFLILTNLRSQKRSQVNVKISDTQNDEGKILKAAMERRDVLGAEGVGTTSRRTQLRPKPKDGLSLQNTNYGLKAYENQNSNASTSSFKIQNSPMQRDVLSSATAQNRRPLRATTATAKELREDTRKNEVHIDNVKFLESMAKIYERSGRVDLANGLTNNIKKAKNNIIR